MCTSISEVSQSIRQFEPDAILLNIDLFPNNRLAALHRDLQKLSGAILAMTTEPLFKNALKAIDLQVAHLFVKPIDLELLKKNSQPFLFAHHRLQKMRRRLQMIPFIINYF